MMAFIKRYASKPNPHIDGSNVVDDNMGGTFGRRLSTHSACVTNDDGLSFPSLDDKNKHTATSYADDQNGDVKYESKYNFDVAENVDNDVKNESKDNFDVAENVENIDGNKSDAKGKYNIKSNWFFHLQNQC